MPQRPSGATTFGVELRRRRLRAGLSTNGLAALMQYSKGYISKVETGAKSPSLDFARRSDAALAAGGRLIALAQATVRSRRTGRSEELSREIARLESGEESAGARGSPPSGVAASSVAASSVAPKAFADDVGTDHSLQAFRTLLESMRELGQTLSPASIVPMLSPHTAALRELSRRVEPALSREALLLAARFAEFTGWMTQEMGDDVAALRWTDQAVEMAQAAGDQDMVAFAYVRRANIALYQQDSYGTISFAKQAQAMECGPRVRGLAALREAQGHALAGDYMAFRRCIDLASNLMSSTASMASTGEVLASRPILGPTKIPDSVALAEGWSLHDLGRSEEAVDVLSRLLDRTPKAASRAWARIGARLALALASIREIDRACAVVQPILILSPVIESATIRADLRQLSRILNRWNSNPSVRRIMPDLSAALTPTADRPSRATLLSPY